MYTHIPEHLLFDTFSIIIPSHKIIHGFVHMITQCRQPFPLQLLCVIMCILCITNYTYITQGLTLKI